MATPNINCILQSALAITNNLISPSPQLATVDLGNPTLGGSVFSYQQSILVPGPPGITISIPAIVNLFLVLVQNIGTNPLSVQFSAPSQPMTILTLGPTGVFLFMDPQEVSTGGISSLFLSSIGTTHALVVIAV